MAADQRGQVDPSPAGPADFLPGLGQTYADALRAIVDRDFCFTSKYVDQQGRADRTGGDADLLLFERAFRKRLFKLGVPVFVHTWNRYGEEQNRLFRLGRSRARAGQSAHNFGCAFDLVHGVKGWDLTVRQWSIFGHIGKELATQRGLEVVWGGDWKFYDPAHWELASWRDIRACYGDGEEFDHRR